MVDINEIINNQIPFKESTGVYFLLKNNKIVYIGQATSLHNRLSQHWGNKDFDSYYFIECPVEELNDLEAKYILEYEPIHNKSLPSNERYKSLEQIKDVFGVSKYVLNDIIRKNKIIPRLYRYYDVELFRKELSC